MKRILFIICLCFQISFIQAQDIGDAVRYSSDQLNGTARFVGMGGAFGALGGDMSSLKVNPAGSAVFLANQASVSLDVQAYKNETSYMDGRDSYRNNTFDLNQAGIVFVFNNASQEDAVSRLSFGVTYNRESVYDNRFTAIGTSNESISNMFLNYAQGVPFELFDRLNGESISDLYAYLGSANTGFNNSRLQAAYLGYEGFLFDAADPSNPNNTAYLSNVSGSSFDHLYQIAEDGANGKLTFNGGLAINDKFYFGLNLNSHFIDYGRSTVLNEFIAQPSNINEINYLNNLDVKGNGFSFQVGGIARLGDMFRVGVSYESPTWYKISEETTQFLRTDSHVDGEAIVNPQVVNVFPDYRMRTPGKVTGSIAAVFGNVGLLSFDYSYKDFSNTEFTSDGFNDLNVAIGDQLQAVSTYRIGGEYRLQNWSLRAGFRYQESPYIDNTLSDLRGYSAGLGYNFGNMRIDFAYDLAQQDYNLPLLNTGFTNKASIENTLSHYVLTFVFAL